MNEGEWSATLGLAGWPAVAEEAIIARDCLLAAHVGSRVHFCHVSTAGSVELVRWAKVKGWNVTAEVTPHHLLLTDELVASYDPVFKVNPPLRTNDDVEALRAALADGTIDAVATDHAPHALEDKETELAAAAFGMTGLETALSVVATSMVETGLLDWAGVADRMSVRPAAIGRLSRQGQPLESGAPANFVLVDPDVRWTVDPTMSASRSRNTPFAGRELSARVVATFLRGQADGLGRQDHVTILQAADDTKKVLIDPHPAWGGIGVGIAALVVFLIFATWIVVQRVRHGKEGDDEALSRRSSSSRTAGPSAAGPTARVGETFGEAVFTTGMTGYQETLTDPSFHRQVVVQTAPHIGNTGINDEDPESRRVWVAGYVVRDPARVASNWRSQRTLDAELAAQGVVGISGIDTRALTRHLRDRGAMRVGVSSVELGRRGAAQRVLASPGMEGADLAGEVTTPEPYVVPAVGDKRFTVAAIDLGIKASTPRYMAERGCEVHVLPANATAADMLAVAPDGVFFSNGPGDPATADGPVAALRGVLGVKPVFGICFGNQVLGRALGFGTYKLKFGHRGVNQPVQDRRTGADRHHQPQPRLRRRRADGRSDYNGVRPGRGEPHRPQRRRRRRSALPRHPGVLGAVPPGSRARSARCDRPVRDLHRADGGWSLMPKRTDINSVLVIGSGSDRHRPGVRVRLLRDAGAVVCFARRDCGSA